MLVTKININNNSKTLCTKTYTNKYGTTSYISRNLNLECDDLNRMHRRLPVSHVIIAPTA